MYDTQPVYVTVVVDNTDELTVIQQQLGRVKKQRWSDALLKRDEIKPMIPPLEFVSWQMRNPQLIGLADLFRDEH